MEEGTCFLILGDWPLYFPKENQNLDNRNLMSNLDQQIQYHQGIVDQHQAILIDLRVRRNRIWNRLAPISRVPPEVLYHVFFIASRDAPGCGLNWIKLTYVCYDWRNLALSSPALWSNPPFQNSRWTEEMLIRSGTANLTIDLRFSSGSTFPSNNDSFLKIVAAHMPRIKCIKVITFSESPKGLLQQLAESGSNLESLTLECGESLLRRCVEDDFTLPDSALYKMNHIRHMNLKRIYINWDLPLPSSLTSLKLSNVRRPSSLTTMTHAFEHMPLLKDLQLIQALPSSKDPTPSNRTIHLDSLRNLQLEDGIAEIVCFLQTVTFPPRASVKISVLQDFDSTDSTKINETISLLGQYMKQHSGHHIDGVRIDCYDYGFRFVCMLSPSNRSSPSYIRMHWKNMKNDSQNLQEKERIIANTFQHFPFNLVTNVHLHRQAYKLSNAILLQTVGSLPHLRRVCVANLTQSFLDLLQSRSTVSENTSCPSIACPGIRSIVIQRTTFHNPPDHGSNQIGVYNLLDCLTWRKQQGRAVNLVELKDCYNLNETKIKILRDGLENAVTVKWD